MANKKCHSLGLLVTITVITVYTKPSSVDQGPHIFLKVLHRATVPLLQRLAMLAQEQQLSAKAVRE